VPTFVAQSSVVPDSIFFAVATSVRSNHKDLRSEFGFPEVVARAGVARNPVAKYVVPATIFIYVGCATIRFLGLTKTNECTPGF